MRKKERQDTKVRKEDGVRGKHEGRKGGGERSRKGSNMWSEKQQRGETILYM